MSQNLKTMGLMTIIVLLIVGMTGCRSKKDAIRIEDLLSNSTGTSGVPNASNDVLADDDWMALKQRLKITRVSIHNYGLMVPMSDKEHKLSIDIRNDYDEYQREDLVLMLEMAIIKAGKDSMPDTNATVNGIPASSDGIVVIPVSGVKKGNSSHPMELRTSLLMPDEQYAVTVSLCRINAGRVVNCTGTRFPIRFIVLSSKVTDAELRKCNLPPVCRDLFAHIYTEPSPRLVNGQWKIAYDLGDIPEQCNDYMVEIMTLEGRSLHAVAASEKGHYEFSFPDSPDAKVPGGFLFRTVHSSGYPAYLRWDDFMEFK